MKSSDLFTKAKGLMPGGVSSPVRAIRPYPFYVKSGDGCRITSVEGTEYIDCCMAYGPLIVGHTYPLIHQAISWQISRGWLFGTPSPLEPEYAELIVRDHPGMEMIRFVSSGSEATMAAIRLARGFTGKPDIVKVEGGFHGAHDGVLVKAGSGAATLGIPGSAGVLPEVASRTRQVPFNDDEALEDLFRKDDSIAAFIVEPVLGNIGPILPDPEYLRVVRKITKEHDVLLIFDEVITGYRLGIGGAQELYQVRPDLTTLGKIIGGGLPIGAFGGRKEIMELIAPSGPVYQAGTFSGNPLSLAAGIATVRWLHAHRGIYEALDQAGREIGEGLPYGAGGSFVQLGSMFKYFFRATAPRNYKEAMECDTSRFQAFWQKMLKSGIFLPPSQFETNFLSAVHEQADIESIGSAYRQCI
jgi:glutamate-1-semialdehyde 2,1-aminomutase